MTDRFNGQGVDVTVRLRDVRGFTERCHSAGRSLHRFGYIQGKRADFRRAALAEMNASLLRMGLELEPAALVKFPVARPSTIDVAVWRIEADLKYDLKRLARRIDRNLCAIVRSA